jgi:small subunit ribosomal protein S8
MNIHLIKFLIQLKNAALIKKEIIHIKYNNLILQAIFLLYKEGLIQSFKINKDKTFISIYLRYNYNKNLLKSFKIISKGSNLVYLKYSDICRFFNKRRLLILSTNKGFLTGLECKKYKLGGKLLFIC